MSEQLSLLPDSPGALAAALEVSGEYTAERVQERRPEACRVAVLLLRQGFGLLSIADTLGMSVNTVARLRDDAGIKQEEQTAALARGSGLVAALAAERLISRLSDKAQSAEIPARDLAIIHGVGVDKAQLLSGGATVRIEHVEGVTLQSILEEHRRLSVDVESVEIGPCACARDGAQINGYGGEERGTKERTGACGIDGSPANSGVIPAAVHPTDRGPGPASSESLSVVHVPVCSGLGGVRDNRDEVTGEKGSGDGRRGGAGNLEVDVEMREGQVGGAGVGKCAPVGK
jgi:hypothetical protein